QLVNGFAVPTTRGREDIATVQRRLEQLLEHEGIPLGPLVEKVAEICLDRGVLEDGADHARDAAGRQRLQLDQLGDAGALPALNQRKEWVPPIELIAAVGDEQQHPGPTAQPAGAAAEAVPA